MQVLGALLIEDTAELRVPIGAAIPKVIDLLYDRESDVQQAACSALAKLAEYSELRLKSLEAY